MAMCNGRDPRCLFGLRTTASSSANKTPTTADWPEIRRRVDARPALAAAPMDGEPEFGRAWSNLPTLTVRFR
jgi:hypothetical protein